MQSNLKVIGLIGYSGSGKTHIILKAIEDLRNKLKLNVAVIKYIHEHQIDKEGKDTYEYCQAGAKFAITKNNFNETVIFIKNKIEIEEVIKWISTGPFKVDLIFIEGFRNLKYPTILCVKNSDEIEAQLTEYVKMISGLICKRNERISDILGLPIVNIEKDFRKFLEIFNLK